MLTGYLDIGDIPMYILFKIAPIMAAFCFYLLIAITLCAYVQNPYILYSIYLMFYL